MTKDTDPRRIAMNIERAMIADAAEISALIRSLSKPFLVSPTGEGSEPFYASVNETATAGYLAATNYSYFVARSEEQLVGVVAVRDNSHLFHLFVAEQFQGQGLGSKLWHLAKAEAMDKGNPGSFTVNSSLNAVPVYESFGFVITGPVVRKHGVAYQPMELKQGN